MKLPTKNQRINESTSSIPICPPVTLPIASRRGGVSGSTIFDGKNQQTNQWIGGQMWEIDNVYDL